LNKKIPDGINKINAPKLKNFTTKEMGSRSLEGWINSPARLTGND
jgi:hypothetical protein